MRRIKRALSVTKAPKIEELADIHEHHEDEVCNQNGNVHIEDTFATNNNKPNDGEDFYQSALIFVKMPLQTKTFLSKL